MSVRSLASLCLVLAACGGPTATPAPETPAAPDPVASSPETPSSQSLTIDVVTSAEAAGAVNSVLLIADDEVVVVDAQFTKSGAEAVTAAVEATGKPLTKVFITHAHPDHYLGTAVLAERFPDAKVVATADVVDEMKQSAVETAKAREGMLGPEFPGMPVIPTVVDSLSVGGQAVELMPKLQGDTHPVTGLWLAEQGTLIVSDVAFSDVHAWTATTSDDDRKAWAKQLDELAGRDGVTRVIPGHQLEGSDQSPAVLSRTKEYVLSFNEVAAGAESPDALIETMSTKYPKLGGALFLKIGAGARFAPAH